MLVQCVLQKFISNEFGPTAYEQSRKAATQKRAAIDIDDDGHQNKKQKYTFKGVICYALELGYHCRIVIGVVLVVIIVL